MNDEEKGKLTKIYNDAAKVSEQLGEEVKMNLIYNSEIVDLANGLLSGTEAQAHIRSLSERNIFDYDCKLIDKSSACCDPDSLILPPVEFR